ncbi:PREDICTED: uncharacterized protein LOC109359981 isoform X2 [Lupinus angustifolius]|uniref:uncharacterized protein LOC109359981 isoform X2 n=1 Tax=Lupinus angustifolius TaxID=3871 RepID=UPI00092F5533|nr:PREDICTED: uncharacterized protein LOC109359981 isoform X2 [Lupinus angustifolius]
MPPRVVKRGAARRMLIAAKESSNATIQNQKKNHEADEEFLNHEQSPVVEEEKDKNSVVAVEDKIIDVKNDVEKVNESIDEYEKDEQLDLEDNYPEYENEEDGGVDYDEKGIEEDDGQEVGYEVEEDPEEDVGEGESDTGDEEVEYVYEEVEEDDDDGEHDEHAGEEHEPEKTADADEVVHHELVTERRKQREFEVFVGGLDKDATEDDLRKVFSEVGVVIEVRLVMNPHTKKNKGFAFLRFETVEQAKRAIADLKNPVINGKQCGVAPCQDNDTLHLGNICKRWTKEALKEKLKHYGVENVDELTLVEDSNNEGMNRGFAFLDFSSHSDAKVAYKRLQKRDVMFGVDKPAKVSFADSFTELGDGIVREAKTVFIDPLPPSWDEEYVRNHLKKYGEIEKIELARNMPASRRKNYGYVTFGTHAAAVECVDSIASEGLGEGDKVKVRAKLSRPLRRRRGKHVSHGPHTSGRKPKKTARPSWSQPAPISRPAPRSRPPRTKPARVVRGIGSRVSPVRPVRVRDRHPVMSMPVRARPVAPPTRSYNRRPAAPAYPKHSTEVDYGRREDLPPPSRASMDYNYRVSSQRQPSYRDYPPRSPGYYELPRSTSHAAPRRGYVDDSYGQRFERPSPPPPSHLSYREGHHHDHDTLPELKRPYSAVGDVPPRYVDTGVRHSRARLDYDYAGSAPQYGDAYGDRSSRGYNGSRGSISSQDTHGMYSSRQGVNNGEGSFGTTHSSGYGNDDYMSRESDVGGSSYSSIYSRRDLGGSSSYMSGGGSRSYY